MKIRSLLLGSVTAAGLATGAYAADPQTLTALNMCDALGKTGLTVSSDTDCLQISGEVKYEFNWGDYVGTSNAQGLVLIAGSPVLAAAPAVPGQGQTQPIANTAAGLFTRDMPGAQVGFADRNLDWSSKLEWNIKVVATADSDGGPVSATVKFKEVQQWVTVNEAYIQGKANPYDDAHLPLAGTGGDHTFGIIADEAYVSIGDGTVIMIGKKGTIMNKGDDEPFNFTTLFNSEKVDKGVNWLAALPDGGHVIQITSDLGNGLSASVGAENLQATDGTAGTLVGVLAYAGDGVTAHITGAAAGFLDGVIENFGVHAGFTGTFDMIQIRGAIAADSTGYWNTLASAAATFDMFKLAVSGEANGGGAAGATDFGVGASITATVADGVTINVGGRYYDDGANVADGYQIAAQVAAAITETITITAEAGVYGNITTATNVPYVSAEVAYKPGGNAAVSAKAEFSGNGAIKGTVKGNKTF